jgi:outer membrane cobalamin receptor
MIRPHGRAYARAVRRPIRVLVTAAVLFAVSAYAAGVDGVVVDQSGRPLPRARITVRQQGSAIDTYADEAGRFEIPALRANDERAEHDSSCNIDVSLAGFRTASVPCGTSPLRVVLVIAPVEETVVVSATMTRAPASQTGLSTTTFTAEDIQRRQSPMASELLRSVPGATVSQTGAPGGVTSLFVRGGESSYNAVLLDGIPLNEPGGTFNFNTLSTENLDRIEVVRGANSALFGSDAMASVVQLFTRRGSAQEPPHGSGQIDGGTYGTLHASASVSGGTRAWDYSLGAARFSTDNRVPNNAFDDTTVSADVGRSLGSSASVRFVGRAELGRTGTPGQTAYGRPDLDAYFDRHDVVGGVTFEQDVTRAVHQRATYSLAASDQSSVNLVADPPYTPTYGGSTAPFEFSDFTYDTSNRLRRHHASYQADWRVTSGSGGGNHLLTVLADWTGERATLEDHLAGTSTSPSRDNIGVSVQHQLLWRAVTTTVGMRVEHNDSFGGAVVPRGSIAVILHKGTGANGDTRLHAAAGGGIKEPTLLQSFSTSPFFHGNPNLQPERSRALELGLEQRLAGDRLKLEATWFDNRFHNIIGLQPTGGSNSEYFNIGLTRGRGAELGAELVPVPTLHVRGGYTFLDSEILESTSPDSTVFAVGNWAFRRPRHSGFAEAAWTWERFSANVVGTMIGRYVDSDFSSLVPPITENPGRTVWGAHFSYRVTSKISGLMTVENLADREYQEPLGYPALRRAIRAGARVQF